MYKLNYSRNNGETHAPSCRRREGTGRRFSAPIAVPICTQPYLLMRKTTLSISASAWSNRKTADRLRCSVPSTHTHTHTHTYTTRYSVSSRTRFIVVILYNRQHRRYRLSRREPSRRSRIDSPHSSFPLAFLYRYISSHIFFLRVAFSFLLYLSLMHESRTEARAGHTFGDRVKLAWNAEMKARTRQPMTRTVKNKYRMGRLSVMHRASSWRLKL